MTLTTCVKLGGSLFNDPEQLRSIVETLVHHAGKVIIVTGSGPFGTTCYQFYRKNDLHFTTEQKRLLISRVRATMSVLLAGFHPSLTLVNSVIQARAVARQGKLPIAEPLSFLTVITDTLTNVEAGSDILAAEVCRLMQINYLVIVTNVDGVKPCLSSDQIFEKISLTALKNMGKTCLDNGIEEVIESGKIECVVLNGAYPERLNYFLQTGEVIRGTKVVIDD